MTQCPITGITILVTKYKPAKKRKKEEAITTMVAEKVKQNSLDATQMVANVSIFMNWHPEKCPQRRCQLLDLMAIGVVSFLHRHDNSLHI